MKFNYYLDILCSLLKVIFIKVKYRASIKIAWKQRIGDGFDLGIKKNGNVEIEEKLYTRKNVHILNEGGKLVIGKNVFMNHNVSITCLGNIKIGDNVTIANNVVIVDHNHDYLNHSGEFIIKNIEIGDNVWIGANAVILPGVSLGNNCIVGAGSVVTKSFQENSVVTGVPARKIN